MEEVKVDAEEEGRRGRAGMVEDVVWVGFGSLAKIEGFSKRRPEVNHLPPIPPIDNEICPLFLQIRLSRPILQHTTFPSALPISHLVCYRLPWTHSKAWKRQKIVIEG